MKFVCDSLSIALQLVENWATVYITGRPLESKNKSYGSLKDIAYEVLQKNFLKNI